MFKADITDEKRNSEISALFFVKCYKYAVEFFSNKTVVRKKLNMLK